jgi:large subunit GTPase 1
MKHK